MATIAMAMEWYRMMMRPSRSAWTISMPSSLITTSRTPISAIGPESMPQTAVTMPIMAIATRIKSLGGVEEVVETGFDKLHGNTPNMDLQPI